MSNIGCIFLTRIWKPRYWVSSCPNMHFFQLVVRPVACNSFSTILSCYRCFSQVPKYITMSSICAAAYPRCGFSTLSIRHWTTAAAPCRLTSIWTHFYRPHRMAKAVFVGARFQRYLPIPLGHANGGDKPGPPICSSRSSTWVIRKVSKQAMLLTFLKSMQNCMLSSFFETMTVGFHQVLLDSHTAPSISTWVLSLCTTS